MKTKTRKQELIESLPTIDSVLLSAEQQLEEALKSRDRFQLEQAALTVQSVLDLRRRTNNEIEKL